MKLEEIRGLATPDIEKQARDAKEELFKLRYGARAESLENTRKIRDARLRVARMLTLLRERQLGLPGPKQKE